MIQFQEKYECFLREHGVGINDQVADSVKSYISYLTSVSRKLSIDIGPQLFSSNLDIEELSNQLTKLGKVSGRIIRNYGWTKPLRGRKNLPISV